MESPSIEQENIIKGARILFRLEKLKKETIDTTIKDIRNLFRLEKENKAIKVRIIKENNVIKDIILRGIRNLFENEENYYKPVRVCNFWSDIYIEYESMKTLSVE